MQMIPMYVLVNSVTVGPVSFILGSCVEDKQAITSSPAILVVRCSNSNYLSIDSCVQN